MDGEYAATSDGSSRKRIKISRDAGCPVEPRDSSIKVEPTEAVPILSSLAKAQAQTAVPTGVHSNGTPCHHEQSLRTLSTDLDAMRQLITCRICQRFLYEPYALTCGHTFCYSCLSQWMGQNHKKSCPDCRAAIEDQPAPSYLIREMVLIFVNRSELLPDGETSEEHNQSAKEEADIVAKDKANTDARVGGLFKGMFRRGSSRMPLLAIRDHSDHVDRCPHCMTEVEDGRCFTCGARVLTEDDDELDWSTDEDDDEDDSSEDLDGDLLDVEAEVDLGFDGDGSEVDYSLEGQADPFHVPFNELTPYLDGDEDEDDDDEHDPSMDGFIDDGPSTISTAGDDEPGSGTAEAGRSWLTGRLRAPAVNAFEISDDDDDDEPILGRHTDTIVERRRHSGQRSPAETGQVPFSTTIDSDTDDDDEGPISATQRQRHRLTNGSRLRPTVIESDDEDDGTPAPTATRSAPGGFSPLQSNATSGFDDQASDYSEEDTNDEHYTIEYGQSPRSLVSDPSEDSADEDGEQSEDLDEELDGESEDDTEATGWGPSRRNEIHHAQLLIRLIGTRASRPSSQAVSSHRLHTLGPQRIRRASPTQPPSCSSLFPNGWSRTSSRATQLTRRANRTVDANTTSPARSAAHRPLRPAHPFNLDNVLANVRRSQELDQQVSRRHGSMVSSQSSSGGGGVDIDSAASSRSSRMRVQDKTF